MSARYDITHGIGLAILTPRLLRYFLEKAPEFLDRFAGFAERVMGLRADEFDSCEALAEAGLVKLEAFYKSIGVPSGLAEPKSRSKRSRYSSENDVLIEKSVKYTDFFLLSIVYV